MQLTEQLIKPRPSLFFYGFRDVLWSLIQLINCRWLSLGSDLLIYSGLHFGFSIQRLTDTMNATDYMLLSDQMIEPRLSLFFDIFSGTFYEVFKCNWCLLIFLFFGEQSFLLLWLTEVLSDTIIDAVYYFLILSLWDGRRSCFIFFLFIVSLRRKKMWQCSWVSFDPPTCAM